MNNAGQPDGGRVAARGFQYQYLRTLEYMLSVVDDTHVGAIRVEGPPPAPGIEVDSVDFDVINAQGQCLLAVQVKSKQPGGSISAGEAFAVLIKLANADAASYQLLTNGQPTSAARHLAVALSAINDIGELEGALRGVLRAFPSRLAQFEKLDEEKRGRLRRCKLLFDERDDVEIRETIRERLRAYRNKVKLGLGEHSAGLLTGYLVSEVLRRAADGRESTLTTEVLRSYMLVAPEDLARAGGTRDWGVVIGPMPPQPDVLRLPLLRQIVDSLAHPAGAEARQVALVGPSGIGKSSLAAAYALDHADSYDYIFWINAETNESVLSSFRYLAILLGGGKAETLLRTPAEHVRRDVHLQLSRMPGPYLMIFDNAHDQRQIQPWIPPTGRGRIISTSIDSSARRGSTIVIDVGTMSESEAIALLSNRFRLDNDTHIQYSDQLLALANGMSRWPLALELASGYMETCGITLANVGYYLSQLKMQSLADPVSLPPDYPQTLSAAFWLSLNQLRKRSRETPVYFAVNMIFNAAYLASRQLPWHMLAVSALGEQESSLGICLVDPGIVNLGEAVRELRRFSMVSFDQTLPSGDSAGLPEASYTIAVNEIVQEIVRTGIEGSQLPNDVSEALNLLAGHAERWLTAAFELNQLERASVLFAHADTLSAHLRRMRVQGKNVALLYGNLAGMQHARGDDAKADALLRAELELAEAGAEWGELFAIQAKLQLLEAFLLLRNAASIAPSLARRYCDEIVRYADSIGEEYPAAAVKLAVDLKTMIEQQATTGDSGRLEFAEKLTILDDLVNRFGPTEYSEMAHSLSMANHFLSKDRRLATAERLCYRILNSGSTVGARELEARRFLVETLARQGKWSEARQAHRAYSERFGGSRVYFRLVSRN